jgi:putative colanic acid biosynthesis acetyltransferase WcaB
MSAGRGGRTSFRQWVGQDWAVNAGRRDSQLVLALFRTAQWAATHGGAAGHVFVVTYELLSSLFLGVELPAHLQVGPRLRLFHPHAIVINGGVRMGADCILRQNVTVGNTVRRDGTEKGIASLGDRVDLGAGCMVLGGVHVGDGARVGAMSLVLHDVPERGVVVGNPARLVRVDDAG